MTGKRFKLQLCSNGIYYVYENGTLTDIDFDKFNKESADALIDEVNALYDENEQLKKQLESEHTMLDNAILLERTRMGKNCLKQFRDAIQ